MIRTMARRTVLAGAGAVLLAACTDTGEDPGTDVESDGDGHEGHAADGGQPPAGILEAPDPQYPVGTSVVLNAAHMDGMEGSTATVSGAFDTTAYSISYTPTDGGDPVTDHRWVVHEELQDPGDAPLEVGTEVVVDAAHMPGMMGATATIDSAVEETVYMVDYEADGMMMRNHMWVIESEMQPTA